MTVNFIQTVFSIIISMKNLYLIFSICAILNFNYELSSKFLYELKYEVIYYSFIFANKHKFSLFRIDQFKVD